jgi:hypothetical protein
MISQGSEGSNRGAQDRTGEHRIELWVWPRLQVAYVISDRKEEGFLIVDWPQSEAA